MITDIEAKVLSMEELYDLLPEGMLVQLINNEIIMSPPPTTTHQSIAGSIHAQIWVYLKEHNVGTAFISPVGVRFDEKNIYEPDVVFVLKENEQMIREDKIWGVPDMLIEVLSPSTKKYDLKEKFNKYKEDGVKEYWVIDQKTKKAVGYLNSFSTERTSEGEIKFDILDLTVHF